jgi:hypothetical protein
MTVSISSPVTGATQTGLTSPTYTHVADQAPDVNAIQRAVTALGGTQTGVDVHSVAKPFTTSVFKPKVFKVLGRINPVTGQIQSVPMNVYKVITRKGVLPLAGQPAVLARMTTIIEIPAGSDTADAANLRGMQSMHIGTLDQVSSGLGDTTINGVL